MRIVKSENSGFMVLNASFLVDTSLLNRSNLETARVLTGKECTSTDASNSHFSLTLEA